MCGNLEKHPLMEGKMSEQAPERIWAWPKGSWFTAGASDRPVKAAGAIDVEYTRTDLAQAAVAAALEGAKDAVDAIDDHNSGPIASALLDARNAVLALITDDAQAALDAVRAEERERICDWLRKNLSDGHTIAAAIREGDDT